MTDIYPQSREPRALFEYSVLKVHSLDMMGVYRVHKQWANIIFNKERHIDAEKLMSIVKHEYGLYFSTDLGEYQFLEDKVRRDFPHLFGEELPPLFDQIDLALDAELDEQRDSRNMDMFRVERCESMSASKDAYIYKATLALEEGEDPHFSEGTLLKVKSMGTYFRGEAVEYNYEKATLFFSSKSVIPAGDHMRIISDATFNTQALRDLLREMSHQDIDKDIPLYKFVNEKTDTLKDIPYNNYPAYLDRWVESDASQAAALKAAIGKDITFVWGPPGTGKSYTLAAIVMALYHMQGERTVVCCLSNVAVDQLLEKVVGAIETYEPKMEKGKFYRAGRTTDDKINQTDFLYPGDDKSYSLREEINSLTSLIKGLEELHLGFSEDAIKRKARRADCRTELKNHTDYLISQVKVVFSTISNFVLNSRLKDATYDNLIVDEASMLAMPQLLALVRNVKKRIILVGDFMQLAPISTTGTPILRDNVFRLCGIDADHTQHPALHPLLNQRRSNPKIFGIINHVYYAGKLQPQNSPFHHIVACEPYNGCPIAMKAVEDGQVRFTKGGTRQNVANAEAVMHLLDIYSMMEDSDIGIGIITPYVGQVSLLRAKLMERKYPLEFLERVRIGTVHTFQGSESDVIIFDMVDCSKFEKGKSYIGKLYAGEQGEQLLNVAISRARHKLIVVCEPGYMENPSGGAVTGRTFKAFKALLAFKYTRE